MVAIMNTTANVLQALVIVVVNVMVICTAMEGNNMEVPAMIEGTSRKLSPFALPNEKVRRIEKRYPQHLDPNLLKFWIQVGECPESLDGIKKYFCPSMTPAGKQVCIDDYQLCNGVKECPNAEDENRHYCLFYKALKSQVELLERSLASLNSAHEAPVRRYARPYQVNYDYK